MGTETVRAIAHLYMDLLTFDGCRPTKGGVGPPLGKTVVYLQLTWTRTRAV